ncbi:MAG TPA: MBL fold metallo-hydrolase [Bryobacteraceae bacterium]|nr:MBL fold metallo-hydrolase [Bryobacteraceae bacterium]
MSRLVVVIALISCAFSAPAPQSLGGGLYSYISDNDSSCNSVFLVGKEAILVVDTGFDVTAGEKLLSAIRSVSSLPVRYIVNTHYHRDHQAANGVVGPASEVASTSFTRERTIAMMNQHLPDVRFRPATIAITEAADIYLDDQQVHLEFPGPAHTMGDLVVYFPAQKVVATGDLFLNHSSPAMDRGSVLNWIHALEKILNTPAVTFVPGHFELATRTDLQRFHDYLADLRDQIAAQIKLGTSWEQIRQHLDMKKYSDFRQFPNFHATFEDNAKVIYGELTQASKEKQ